MTWSASSRDKHGPARWKRAARRALACALAVVAVGSGAQGVAASPWAGMADTVFEHIGQHDGLPHAIATAITQDDQGFLWAGTQEGLARWDGYRFRVWAAAPDDPHGLPTGFVRALQRDALGRIWVGLDNGGLARFDDRAGRFVRFGKSSALALSPDTQGGMWAATMTGLLHVDAHDVVETPWRHDGAGVQALPDVGVTAILADRAGTLWIGMASGLVQRHTDGRPGAAIELPGLPPEAAAGVNALFQDRAGRVWIGTGLHGTYVCDPGAHRARRLVDDNPADPGLATDSVTSFAATADGDVWIGTETRGIVVVDAAGRHARRVVRDKTVATDLQSNWVWGLYSDRSSQMWVASTSGLSRTRPRLDAVLSVFAAEAKGWSDPSIIAVDAAPDGTVALGQHGGLEVIDPLRRRFVAVTASRFGDHDAPSLGYIAAIARTPDGRRFLGAKEGLFMQPAGGARLESLPLPQRGPVKGVTALMLDGRTLWIGGKGDGLWQMDIDAAAHEIVRPPFAGALTDPQVNVILRDPDGSTWAGTKNGLNRLVAGRPIERIMPSADDPHSLPHATVSTLLTDRQGRLWVGTNAGMAVLERRDGAGHPVFHRFGKADGLTSLNIDTLLLDGSGRIWASTDDGLAVVDPATLQVTVLHGADGVGISTYWANSGAVGPQGELFFGGLGGLTVVRPDRLKRVASTAAVVATEMQVGGVRVDAAATTLTVPPEAGSFAVEFSLLDFAAPDRSRYAYRLEGYDKDWRDVDTMHRLAAYTNLAPGHYRLLVKAADHAGTWSPRPLSVDVEVRPAWYQTWWFLVLKVVLATAAAWAVFAVRVRYVKRRNAQLERLVEQRTQQMTDLQRQLEKLAYSDSLTGLPNRRMFADACRQLVARADRHHGEGFALLLIDLDRFKQVNDTLGHDAGDALLVEVARRLRALARESDVVARLGGDEFAILLDGAATDAAVEIVCRRVADAFLEPTAFEGRDLRTSPSIGIAIFPADGRSQDALYKAADLALYEAKRSGRNTWRRHATKLEPA